MTDEQLIVLIRTLTKKRERLEEIDDIPLPLEPKVPIHCTFKGWEKYRKKRKKFEEVVVLKTDNRDKLQEEIPKLKLQIMDGLPAKNVWFVTECGKYAVAHQTNDWAMDPGTLHIKEKPNVEKLSKIQHQISA